MRIEIFLKFKMNWKMKGQTVDDVWLREKSEKFNRCHLIFFSLQKQVIEIQATWDFISFPLCNQTKMQ